MVNLYIAIDMKSRLYGNKMFVADLVVVSVWALFNLRTCAGSTWPMLIYIVMRVALCFQMYSRSRWTLYSAVAFLFAGSSAAFIDTAYYPFRRAAYYIGSWTGNGKEVLDAFAGRLDSDLSVWLTILGAMLSLWVFGLPLLVGMLQRNHDSVARKRKWVIIYLVCNVLISLPIVNENIFIGLFMLGALAGFLPVVYWSVYLRQGRSVFDLLCNYKPLVRYLTFVIPVALCLFVGADHRLVAKTVVLTVVPPILYALLSRWCGVKPLTRHAVSLGVCGSLYSLVFTAPGWLKVITLSVSILLAVYVAIDLALRSRSYVVGVVQLLIPTVVVAPLTLGLNPYVVVGADRVRYSADRFYANNGHFIIEKNGKLGLRDRYGLILQPDYDRFESLDKPRRYISTYQNTGSMIADDRYGVFDLVKHEFVLDPNEVAVIEITYGTPLSYNLIAPDRSVFATLLLPGFHPELDEYFWEAAIVAYHAPAELTLEEDAELAEWANETDGGQ